MSVDDLRALMTYPCEEWQTIYRPFERHGLGGKKTVHPLFPKLSQYWRRHTWATIAAELDIPKEAIAAGLGHELGNSTTAIYINFNMKKVDVANRKIIDYVLYGKYIK